MSVRVLGGTPALDYKTRVKTVSKACENRSTPQQQTLTT